MRNMRSILRKEVRLSTLPIVFFFALFGLMFLLPGYPVLCGAFFLTLGLYQNFKYARECNDLVFSVLLPIAKKDVVKGKFALACLAELLSFALMLVRGLYGKWLYRRSAAARIRRIRAEFPDPEQRRAVLNAQGGVSIAACIGAFILLMIVGSLCSMLLGPDLNALVGTFI